MACCTSRTPFRGESGRTQYHMAKFDRLREFRGGDLLSLMTIEVCLLLAQESGQLSVGLVQILLHAGGFQRAQESGQLGGGVNSAGI